MLRESQIAAALGINYGFASAKMTPPQESIFELSLRLVFYEKHGDEFQIFFSRLMGLRYPTDFVPTRPWGNIGDRKCDGYLRSNRTLFQCFAPNYLALSNTISKMREDFEGALGHQTEFWDRWVFVHNSPEGRLSTDIVRELVAFEQRRPGIRTEVWGYHALRRIALELNEADLRTLLPTVPSAAEFSDLVLSDLKPVIDHLAAAAQPPDEVVEPTPPGKIEFNRLSPAAAQWLTLGMVKSPLLDQYFRGHPDKTFGDRIAAQFRKQYLIFREEGGEPDDILAQLFAFASGPLPSGNFRRDAAVWTVLAYLFQHCEIFERPEKHTL